MVGVPKEHGVTCPVAAHFLVHAKLVRSKLQASLPLVEKLLALPSEAVNRKSLRKESCSTSVSTLARCWARAGGHRASPRSDTHISLLLKMAAIIIPVHVVVSEVRLGSQVGLGDHCKVLLSKKRKTWGWQSIPVHELHESPDYMAWILSQATFKRSPCRTSSDTSGRRRLLNTGTAHRPTWLLNYELPRGLDYEPLSTSTATSLNGLARGRSTPRSSWPTAPWLRELCKAPRSWTPRHLCF